MLLLSIPVVQTRLGTEATHYLNQTYKTDINVGRVGLQFNGDVELKEILIKDFKKDTLISASELNTSIINFKNLINGTLNFGDIDLEKFEFNVVTYKGETDTNLDVFVARFDDDNPRPDKSDFLLSSSDVTIYDGAFRMINENKETPKIIEFNNLNINATNFLIDGSDVKARINKLAFNDSRGLKMKKMVTNFSYTLEEMRFDELDIETENSSLKGELIFSYNREDFKEFEDKVKVNAKFNDADIALDELNTFYNEFGKGQHATFSTTVSGTLNNLTTNNLRLNTSSNTKIYGDINFKNLFNSEDNNFAMQGEFSNLSSNYKDLKRLLPNVLGQSIPAIFDKLGNFKLVGSTKITTSKVVADFEINTNLGYVDTDLVINRINDINNANYQGNIILDEFEIGKFLDDKTLGKTSLNLDVDGRGFTKENVSTNLLGSIYSLNYNNYTYREINVEGKLKEKVFNGKLVSNDKNLKLKFDGLADFSKTIYVFDFVADVDYADLKALNLITKNTLSTFEGEVEMNMKGTTVDNVVGDISFKNTKYVNENDTYEFKDFAVTSTFNKEVHFIKVNSPDIIEGQLSGVFKFEDIPTLFDNSVRSIYTKYTKTPIDSYQYIDFNFKIYNKIVEVFYPELKLGANTNIRGRVETDEKEFKLSFKSPQIELFNYFAKDIELQVDNNNPLFNTYIEVDSINTKFYDVSKFNLINVTVNDTLFMRSEFKGGKGNTDDFNLSFYHTIDAENKSVVGFKKSDVTFKGNTWYLNNKQDNYNKVVFDSDFKNFNIEQLIMNHNNEEIKLAGVLRGENYKDLKLNFKDVDLAKITPRIDSLSLAGNVNGKLDVLQENGNYLPNSSIVIDDLTINKHLLGSFDAKITGDASLTNYKVNAKIKDDFKSSFTAIGSINVAENKNVIDVDLTFKEFSLIPLNPLLDGVLKDIRGDVFGTAKVIGNLDKPDINGKLNIENGGLGVIELNTDYSFANNASVTLNNQSFNFNNIAITDTKFDSKGKLNGSISHVNFSKWSLDLDITSDRLLVLNTKETPDALYYGTGFIGGEVSLYGPTEALRINAIAETKAGTVFKIPLNDNESFGDNSFIHFLTPEEKLAKEEGREFEIANETGLQMDFELDVTEEAEIEIVIDKTSGSTIKGRGVGSLLFNINTNGKFDMYGDFIVYEGEYNFLYAGLVEKRFVVKPYESTLQWNGDPLKALINIQAIYETNANPSALLDNPINRTIPVKLEIKLTDQLERPEIDYEFKFPNVSSAIKSELQYRLESREDREKQALFFLASGTFNRGLNDLSLTGTLTERLNGLVNSILSSGDGKFNIGLNYEAGQDRPDFQTDDRFGVTLQTKISDRILVNGKVGVPIGGASETAVAGDVQIDFLLNDEGTLAAKVFNRENSIRNFGEEIGYTQGIGLSYSVEFDTMNELLNKIFKSKEKQEEEKKAKEEAEARLREQDSISNLPPSIGFKTEAKDTEKSSDESSTKTPEDSSEKSSKSEKKEF